MTVEGPGEPQWLREDEPPELPDGQWEQNAWVPRSPTVVRPAVLAWALGAVLAIIAPFFTLSEVHIQGLVQSSDGWGRVHIHATNALVTSAASGHSTRGGIVFAVAAAVLLLAVVAWVSRGVRVAAVFGALGSAALVACAGFVGLTAEAVTSFPSRDETVQLGAGVWLSMAAGVVALVGVVLAGREVLRAT